MESQITETSAPTFLRRVEDVANNMTESSIRLFSYTVTTGNSTPKFSLVQVPEIWTADVIQRVATIIVIMLFSLIGNAMVIIVLSCSRYRNVNRINIFIINLSIGDLAVCLITMTTEILFVAFGEWVLGEALCKLLTYIQIVTLASTTFIQNLMAHDRYIAICQPLRLRSSHNKGYKRIAYCWFLALIFAIPQLLIFVQTVDNVSPDGTIKYGCRSQGYTSPWQRKVYFSFLTIYILIVPSIVISFCYGRVAMVIWNQGRKASKSGKILRKSFNKSALISRAKLKTIKLTLAIIVLFIVCWSPYFITTLILIYSDYHITIPQPIIVCAETLALLQSAINPLLYGVFNIPIKRGLKDVFCQKKKSNTKTEIQKPNFDHRVSGEFRCLRNICSQDTHSSSSSGQGRFHGCIIAESNIDGYKLRVRFLPKEKGVECPFVVPYSDSHQDHVNIKIDLNKDNLTL